jgi:hypothetical protein
MARHILTKDDTVVAIKEIIEEILEERLSKIEARLEIVEERLETIVATPSKKRSGWFT